MNENCRVLRAAVENIPTHKRRNVVSQVRYMRGIFSAASAQHWPAESGLMIAKRGDSDPA